MKKLDRLIAVILLLHSKKIIKAEEIAEHFGISLRTVYRDMNVLAESGLPIAAEPGRGYSIVSGYHLPPVMFTKEEASALFVSSQFLTKIGDGSLQRSMKMAFAKIRSVLSYEKQNYIEELERSMALFPNQSPAETHSKGGSSIEQLQEAIISRSVIDVEYFAQHNAQTTRREIEPLGLLYYGDHWHLVAYCRLRQELRDFRTDRILRMTVTSEQFTPPKDFSLVEYVRVDTRLENPIEIGIEFSHNVVRFAQAKQHFGLIDEKPIEGGVLMTFIVPSLDWIASWLMMFGKSVNVLYPKELQAILVNKAKEIIAQY